MLDNLPFLTHRRKKKIVNTLRALNLIYQTGPRAAVFEALCFFADAFLVMYEIMVFGRFLDETVKYVRSQAEFSLRTYFASSSFRYFLFLFLIWVLINFFKSVKTYLQKGLQTIFRDQVFPDSIIRKISSLNMGDVESSEFQDLFSNVNTYAASRIWDTYIRSRQVIHSLIKVLSATFFIVKIHPLLPLGAIIPVIPEVVYKYGAKKRKRGFLEGVVEKNKFINNLYNQVIRLRNFPELKVNRSFDFLYESRNTVARELSEGVLRKEFDQYIKGFSFSLGGQIVFRVLLISLVVLTLIRDLTIGTFQAAFRYMLNLYDASLYFFDRLSAIGANANYICDYYDLLSFEGFGDVSTGDERLGPGIPSIQVESLTFTYSGREEPTLRDVSFSIGAGEKVAMIGPDGSGETTLLRLLCGLYKITLGDIHYDNISIKSLARGELKSKISALFENSIRYNMSLRKSIVISDAGRDFNRSLYNEVLRVTLLDRWVAREGITDSQILGRVQRGGVELSAAHWQRIALARCLYRNRSVFFMDEPLSLVDSVKRRRIFRNMLDFIGGRTLVVTLHGLEEASMFDRLFRVSSGKVSEISLREE